MPIGTDAVAVGRASRVCPASRPVFARKMLGETAFFQIAAGLIPALLFGGLVSQSLTPRKLLRVRPTRARRVAIGFCALCVVVFSLVAELVAIDLAISPRNADTWKVIVVVYALVIASALIGLALLWPWLPVIRDAIGSRWLPKGIGPPALILSLAIGSLFLTASVNESIKQAGERRTVCYAAQLRERTKAREREIRELSDEIDEGDEKLAALSAEKVGVALTPNLSKSQSKQLRASIAQREKIIHRRQLAVGKQLRGLLIADELPELVALIKEGRFDELLIRVGC